MSLPNNEIDPNVAPPAGDVNKIALRLPSFWTSNPKLYFAQIEANFTLSNITSETTKFCCLISALDEQVMLSIADLIAKPDLKDPYTTVKNRLIEEFSISDSKRIQTLLQDLTLGDSKPSALLRRMRDLAGSNFSDHALKSMWMSLLPTSVQTVLSISQDNLETLAGLADRVFELSNVSPNISAVKVAEDLPLRAEIQSLKDDIKALTSQIRQLSRPRSFSRSRFGNRGNVRPRNDSQNNESDDSEQNTTKLCWYHKKFADKADRCIKPCGFDLN